MKALSFLQASLIYASGRRLDKRTSNLKETLFTDLSGTVVEIGAGAGSNTALFPPGIREYIAIEPNTFLCDELKRLKVCMPCTMRVVKGVAEDMPLDSGSADAIVCTFVLCSVHSQEKTLSEVVRVLKPGGRFIFLEHVAAPRGTFVHLIQMLCSSLSRRLCGGCQWHRDTGVAIHNAPWSVTNICMSPPLGQFSFAPTIAGYCIK